MRHGVTATVPRTSKEFPGHAARVRPCGVLRLRRRYVEVVAAVMEKMYTLVNVGVSKSPRRCYVADLGTRQPPNSERVRMPARKKRRP